MKRSFGAMLAALLLAGLAPESLRAQEVVPTAPAPAEERLRVYLDCEWRCDFDFLRTEVRFVDYVNNRQDADVHVLVTTQGTGAGGTEFTLQFIGQRTFQGVNDELRYASRPTDAEDNVRRGFARVLMGGLVRYAMHTPVAGQLQVSFGPPPGARPGAAPVTLQKDPWDHWVFTARVGGFFNGEKSYQNRNLNGSVSASRTTDAWRTSLSLSTRQSRSQFEVGQDRTVTNFQRDHSLHGMTVKSLSNHWSAGVRSSANHSTFLNRDLALRLAPAVEFNVFPYSESTRRQLTFQYSLGANQIDYDQVTIFDKTSEVLADEQLEIGYTMKRRWGTIQMGLEGSHYFHDKSKYRLETGGELELKLFKGVSLNIWGQAERIRDQLHLAKGRLTDEQILLRQRQLATNHRYFGSVGLSYRFGSIFNNVVNPRMNSGGGGGNVMFF